MNPAIQTLPLTNATNNHNRNQLAEKRLWCTWFLCVSNNHDNGVNSCVIHELIRIGKASTLVEWENVWLGKKKKKKEEEKKGREKRDLVMIWTYNYHITDYHIIENTYKLLNHSDQQLGEAWSALLTYLPYKTQHLLNWVGKDCSCTVTNHSGYKRNKEAGEYKTGVTTSMKMWKKIHRKDKDMRSRRGRQEEEKGWKEE